MKKKFRGLLSLVLAVVMTVGLLPLSALPARAEGEAADPLGLHGQTFAIVNPHDGVAMTAEFADTAGATALKNLRLDRVTPPEAPDSGRYSVLCNNQGDTARICVWSFTYEAGQYFISTGTESGSKYLKFIPAQGSGVGRFELVSERAAASPITAVEKNGLYRLSAPVPYEGASYDVAISSDAVSGIFGGWAGDIHNEEDCKYILQALCTEADITEPGSPGPSGDAQVTGVSPLGTTIDIFDYWVTNPIEGDGANGTGAIDLAAGKYIDDGINGQSQLKFSVQGPTWPSNNINQWTSYNGDLRTGIVKPRLGADGYPVLAAEQDTGLAAPNGKTRETSLGYLFDGQNIGGAKAAYPDVKGLFRVDEDGYYYFDSANTAAQLVTEGDEKGSFRLFDMATEGSSIGFFPFNTAVAGHNGYQGSDNTYPNTGKVNSLNHFFGVRMTTQFIQSAGGLTDEGQDVTYDFTGDDDVWIFLDGVLVGDIGGIHNAANVNIDFATGDITYKITDTRDESHPVLKDYSTANSTMFDQYRKAVGEENILYYTAQFNADGSYTKTGEAPAEADAQLAEVTVGNNVYIFKKSGGKWIFADGTYHTLDFFYLERGGGLSNMRLKFNLEEIPPTYVKKVDQDGVPLAGVSFELYVLPKNTPPNVPAAQDGLAVPAGGQRVATGLTDGEGQLLLTYSDDMGAKAGKVLSLADLYNTYKDELWDEVTSSGGLTYNNVLMLDLREKKSGEMAGYRGLTNISLRLEKINGTYIMRSNDRWNNGVYAIPSVTVSASKNITLFQKGNEGQSVQKDLSALKEGQVGLFAVVLGWIKKTPPQSEEELNELSNWGLVQGNPETGWTIKALDDRDYTTALGRAIGDYAQANNGSVEGCAYPFSLAASGSYNTVIQNLPGEIDSYYFMISDQNGNLPWDETGQPDKDAMERIKFTAAFYYSDAVGWENMNGTQTFRVDHRGSKFERDFGATVNVPNIQERLVVQRLDAVGNTVTGAEFTLFGPVTPKLDGTDISEVSYDPVGKTLTVGGNPVTESKRETTENLVKDKPNGGGHIAHLTIAGAAAFHSLSEGVYYLVETKAPAGYTRNQEIVKVIVDKDGVHAYAGENGKKDGAAIDPQKGIPYGDGDGISVLLGPGRLVRTMASFGSAGEIDTTLTDIYALRARARQGSNWDSGDAPQSADVLGYWHEVPSRDSEKYQRKWRVYDPNSPLEYTYATGTDTLGNPNQHADDENPSGYISASGWNWDLLTQNYYGIYDLGVSYNEINTGTLTVEQQAAIKSETSTKTRLPCKTNPEDLDTDVNTGYTSYGNKILTGLFSGTTVVRVASDNIASLSISKKVDKADDTIVVPQDAQFSFSLSFGYTAPELDTSTGRTERQVGDIDLIPKALAGEYAYTVTGGGSTETGTLTIAAKTEGDAQKAAYYVSAFSPNVAGSQRFTRAEDGGAMALNLKDGETLTIDGLPVGTSYTVSETAVPQYSTGAVVSSKAADNRDLPVAQPGEGSPTASNTLAEPGQADTVAYTNTYAGPAPQVTVEYYRNEVTPGTKVNDPTGFLNPFAVNIGTTWTVGVGTTGNSYDAPKTISDNGATYAYDPNATTVVKTADGTQIADASFAADTISREMGREDVTVRLVYALDGNGDQIPDKYQVTVRYESEDTSKGTVSGPEEILTITGADGKYAETGNVTAAGSAATAVGNCKFKNWTGIKISAGATENLTDVPTDSTTGQISLTGVKGGDVYTYTAHFEETVKRLDVEKTLTSVGGTGLPTATGEIPKAKAGDTIVWTITVTNTGNVEQNGVTLDNLVLTDQMQNAAGTADVYWDPDGTGRVPYTAGTTFSLDPGEELTFTAEYVVQEADAGKDLNNTAIVKGPDDEEQDTPNTPVPMEKRGLSITKAADRTAAMAGDIITWTITVSNTGNVELQNVLVTDALAIGVETGYVTADGWEKAEAEGVMQTTIDSLMPGASRTFTATCAVPEGTPENTVIKNVAAATCGDLSASDQAEVTTTDSSDPGPGPVDPTPGIAVTKTLTAVNGLPYYGGTVREGDVLTYTIIVTNTGNVELTAVSLADQLPGGLYPTGAQGWELGSMRIGDRREASFTAVVAPGTSGWALTNTATATGTTAEGDPVTASDAETVQVEIPYVPPIPPVPPIDPEPGQPVTPPEDLNTEDHVAYIIGYPDGSVRPDGDITRAEVATIFFRLLTDEARETYWCQVNSYTDVPVQRWYNNAVSTLSNMGIISGYPDGSFRPDAPITRAELTKIAVGFFQYADQHFSYQGDFSDVTGREWYAGFVAAASALGLIEGYPDGTFRPDEAITRAETCTIVNRTLGRKPHEDHLLPYEVMITWPDNRLDAWYYAQIQEATNSHDYLWISITENWEAMEAEEWTAKLEERDWAALEHMWSTAHSAPGGEVMG